MGKGTDGDGIGAVDENERIESQINWVSEFLFLWLILLALSGFDAGLGASSLWASTVSPFCSIRSSDLKFCTYISDHSQKIQINMNTF